MKNVLEKSGSYGSIIAAAACPVCFPKLALFGALFGLGAFSEYETAFFFGAQLLIIIAVAGNIMSYKKHRNGKLLSIVIFSAALFFISLYVFTSEILSYIALTGLLTTTIWLIVQNRRCRTCELPPTNQI